MHWIWSSPPARPHGIPPPVSCCGLHFPHHWHCAHPHLRLSAAPRRLKIVKGHQFDTVFQSILCQIAAQETAAAIDQEFIQFHFSAPTILLIPDSISIFACQPNFSSDSIFALESMISFSR